MTYRLPSFYTFKALRTPWYIFFNEKEVLGKIGFFPNMSYPSMQTKSKTRPRDVFYVKTRPRLSATNLRPSFKEKSFEIGQFATNWRPISF